MSQFTEAQMATVKAAIEFLAETQRAMHSHVADDVQSVLDLFNPVFEEAPVEEVAEEKPAKAKKAKAEEAPAEEAPAEETPAEEAPATE